MSETEKSPAYQQKPRAGVIPIRKNEQLMNFFSYRDGILNCFGFRIPFKANLREILIPASRAIKQMKAILEKTINISDTHLPEDKSEFIRADENGFEFLPFVVDNSTKPKKRMQILYDFERMRQIMKRMRSCGNKENFPVN